MRLSNGDIVSFAPQALAELTPLLSTGYWYATDGIWLDRAHATYGALYKGQPWVAAVVDKLASLTARLSLRCWDMTRPAGKVLDLTSDYARLIARPCPTMPPFAFWRWIESTYEVYGETYALKVRDARRIVRGLLPMHPTRTAITRDADGIETYVFTLGVASAGILRAPQEDVVPFRRFNPDGTMRGLSRLEPLRSTLMNEDAARRATQAWWRRSGRPSVILSTDKKLSDVARGKLKASWDSAQGGVDNAGGTAVLEEGITPTIVQLSAEEMQYIESRKLNREEVCGVFDMPPPALHILDHATFSNITEQNRMIYRDTMAPRLEDLESILDFYVRPEFGSGVYASFALDEVLRGDFETRATAVQSLVSTGVMMPSEARPLFDLPDAGPVADQLYGNAALVPLGSNTAEPDADEPLALPSGSTEMRALMGRIGRLEQKLKEGETVARAD